MNSRRKGRAVANAQYNEFRKHVDHAIELHDLETIFVAYSGGTDSATVLELARMLPMTIDLRIMTIDTGINSFGHIQRIKEDVRDLGLPLHIYSGKGLDWYLQNALEYGFAYTPNAHVVYYRNLKERAILDCIKEVKTKYHQRIGFITGVRRLESHRRKNTPYIKQHRSRVTINAIADFTEDDKTHVLNRASWYMGKLTEDCLCNWHCKYRISDLPTSCRDKVKQVSDELVLNGMWGYGDKPSREMIQLMSEQTIETMPDDSFCTSCTKK